MDFGWSWPRTKGRDYIVILNHVFSRPLVMCGNRASSGGDEALKHLAHSLARSCCVALLLFLILPECWSSACVLALAIPPPPSHCLTSDQVGRLLPSASNILLPFSLVVHRLTSLNHPALGFRSSCTTLNWRTEDTCLCLSLCLSVSSSLSASKLTLHVDAPQLACIGFEVWRHLKLLGAE